MELVRCSKNGIFKHHAALKFIKIEGRLFVNILRFVFSGGLRRSFYSFLVPADKKFIDIGERKLCGFFDTFFVCKMYKFRRNVI